MKKLMIALVAGAIGFAANAASYSWAASSGRLFDGLGDAAANRFAGTGYLFDAASVSQATLMAAFVSTEGVGTILSSALATGAFSSGRASASAAFTGPDNAFDAYFVVFGKDADGNDAIYFSDMVVANYQTVGESDVTFGKQNAFSAAGFKDATSGYVGAGWYTAAPEPTSGLLMLLGMAGLALRRRRV